MLQNEVGMAYEEDGEHDVDASVLSITAKKCKDNAQKKYGSMIMGNVLYQ